MAGSKILFGLAILAASQSVMSTPGLDARVEQRGDSDTFHSGHIPGGGTANYTVTCTQIASKLSSSSSVHYPGSTAFQPLSAHWVTSSNDAPACVIEAGTTSDIGKILKAVGQTRTPFAVQSGGHTTNPGFSSTKGVHISLNGFRGIEYSSASKTVKFGTGLRWDDVYAALEPYNVSVVGGRVSGVGVGGFALGGGYGWRTNQFGLTIDTITELELVKPNGEVVKVSEKSDRDLFFGLRGGQNNFGIVTSITLKTFPQGLVWGGSLTFMGPEALAAAGKATAKFSAQVKDPKASMLATNGFFQGAPVLLAQIFYDGPTPPAGIFDDFLAIPAVQTTVATRTFLSLVKDSPGLNGVQGYFQGLSVPAYSPKFTEFVTNLTTSLGQELVPHSLVFLTFVVEPFLPSILSHNKSPTAYPFNRSKVYTPFNIFAAWADPSEDAVFKAAIDRATKLIYAALAEEGHEDAIKGPLYPNYALWDTPLERLYGSNIPALKVLKRKVDPSNVMGLAGGFKL